MADSKKYNGSTWVHSLRKLGTGTDSITILPQPLYADGNSATVGLLGNMQQTGTPTPENPITPQETGERTGNLCPNTGWQLGQYSNGVWDASTPNRITSDFFGIEEGKQYTISINNGTILSFININYFDSQKTWLGNRSTLGMAQFSTASQRETTPNMPVGSAYMKITVRPYNNIGDISLSDIPTSNIMSNEGSTAPTSYIPYGFKIPISSANTTTPVYLGETQSTRRIKKLVLDGTESWASTGGGDSAYVRIDIGTYQSYIADIIVCSHCEYANITTATTGFGCDVINSQANNKDFLAFRLENYQSVTPLKNYLAQQYANGTPVTVWCVLTEPSTGIVNEPLRKIGDYADSITGVTIPTLSTADTFDVDTTLKPSEVELTYTGWHDAEVKEWDGSEWKGEDAPALLSLSRPEPTELTETTEEPEQEVEDEQSI